MSRRFGYAMLPMCVLSAGRYRLGSPLATWPTCCSPIPGAATRSQGLVGAQRHWRRSPIATRALPARSIPRCWWARWRSPVQSRSVVPETRPLWRCSPPLPPGRPWVGPRWPAPVPRWPICSTPVISMRRVCSWDHCAAAIRLCSTRPAWPARRASRWPRTPLMRPWRHYCGRRWRVYRVCWPTEGSTPSMR